MAITIGILCGSVFAQDALTDSSDAPETGVVAFQGEDRSIMVFNSPTDAKWLCETFMMKLIGSGVQDAFEELKPYFPLSEAELSMIAMQTLQQFELIKSRFGQLVGYQLVKEEMVNNVILRFIYIQKFEKHAVRWIFYFYKPADQWMFNEFYIDDKLKDLFAS